MTLGKIKNLLIASAGTTLIVLSFIGTISATMSWFLYATKATASYSGTSISANKQLQVGIVTDFDMSEYNCECDGKIAWTLPGAGLSQTQIKAYLSQAGHATTKLKPVTSREYKKGNDLSLYSSPNTEIPLNGAYASKTDYVKLPLAFRVINVADGSYAKNKDIWVTDSSVHASVSEGYSVKEGIRVFFSSSKNKFLFSPGKDSTGSTRVGGLLDFNEDGFYDFDNNKKEIIYGDYEGTPTYALPTGVNSELDDVNDTKSSEPYLFYSRHKGTASCISNLADIKMKKASYECPSSIAPTVDDEGFLKGGLPVCNTGDTYIAYTDMTIYVEGWDQVVVNEVASLGFELGLTFEINKQ